MGLKNKKIKEILGYYNIGTLKSYKKLKSGHHSTNYFILTTSGPHVLRVFHEKEKDLQYILKIYDYLISNRIKTAKPIPTVKGGSHIKYQNKLIGIQSFIEGGAKKNYKKFISFYGRYLGKVQCVFSKLKLKSRGEDSLKQLRRLAKNYMPKDPYIREKYSEFERGLKDVPLKNLKRSIINSDCGPDDFLFKDNKFKGILDFGDSHFNYVLYDIATTMMYCGIYRKDKKKEYLSFIKAYLKEFSLPKEELKYLPTFLKMRFLLQAIYHWSRFKQRIHQGTGNVKGNLKGVEDAKKMLKELEKVSKDFYLIA